jgi:integrase
MKADRADFNQAEGWLRLKAATQKHKADQVFKLHPDTLAALEKIVKPGPGPLFPWPWDPKRQVWRSLHRQYRKFLERAGFRPGKRDMFHKIRRTTATYLADQAGPAAAQAYLGHSCLSVTEAYLDPTKIHAVRATEIMPRPVFPAATGAHFSGNNLPLAVGGSVS